MIEKYILPSITGRGLGVGLLLLAFILGACSNDDEQVPQQPNSYPLTIEVTENPMVQDGEEGGTTRVAITDNSTLNSFKMDYVYGGTYTNGENAAYSATNTSGTWTTTGTWPSTGDNNTTVNWYAYSSGTFYLTDDANRYPYISFTVDETVASQHDLLVATASGTYSGTNGNLSFNFDHACAALRFYVKKANALSGTLNITSIKLCNVYKGGRYYYGNGTWTVSTTIANPLSEYSLSSNINNLGSDTYQVLNGSEDNSYLFLIPQELTAWNSSSNPNGTYIEVVWALTGVNAGSGTAKIPLAMSLEKGKKYNVRINLGLTALSN